MIFFLFAAVFRTDKVTDLSYSLTFGILGVLMMLIGGTPYSPERILIFAALMLWALRLGSYLFHRILVIGKDARFDDKRNNPLRFLIFWLLQALTAAVVMLPQSHILSGTASNFNGIATIIGLSVFAIGLLVEWVADHQKFCYRNNSANSGHWVDTGLWKHSRHPNYFGEILVWWGLFIVAVPTLRYYYWFYASGPVFITLLLLFVSGIPLLERSADSKYSDNVEYQKYKKSVSILIPLPHKKI